MSYQGRRPWEDESFDQNVGVPGVVYVLRNPFFRDGFYKIGCTRTSGWVRARELDAAAKGAIPKGYACVYEKRSVDCGRAEQRTFEKLHEHRRGQHFMDGERFAGQEFFEIQLERAISAIEEACNEIQAEYDAEQVRLRAEREERQRTEAAERERQDVLVRERDLAGEALGEVAPRLSGPPGWERPKAGPSPVAIGAMLAAVFAAYVYLNRSGTSTVQRQTAWQPPARVQIPRANPSPVGPYFNPPSPSTQDAPAMTPPLVSEQGERFPPGGSAYYFTGRAEGPAVANVLRLYAPPASTSRFAVLVVRVPSDQVYAQAYLEPNDVVDVPMPEGRFRLAYASGNEWLGRNQMFGPSRPARSYGREFHVGRGDAMVRVELPVE